MKQTKHPKLFNSLSGGFRLTVCLVVILIALAAAPHVSATVIANGSLQLESLTITASSGVVNTFGYSALATAAGANSLNEVFNKSENTDNPTAFGAITWVEAGVSVQTRPLPATAAAVIGMGIPGTLDAEVHGIAEGDFYFSLDITGATGPVSVTLDAVLPYMLSVSTDKFGRGTGVLGFSVFIAPPVDIYALYWSPNLTVGRNSSSFISGTHSMERQVTLMAGQTYDLAVDVTAWVPGAVNTSTTPEPATLILFLGGLLPPMVIRRWRSSRS
jgi:hypothetical protein